MKVYCHTNLDLFYEEWPVFETPNVPRIGDVVESKTKHSSGFVLALEVYSVVWTKEYVEVELHIKKSSNRTIWTITQFYEWYAPLVGKSVSYFI